MSRTFPELQAVKLVVEPATRDRHLQAVRAELAEATRPRSRRRLLTIALATVLLVPVVAFAAEQSLPGDFLYPIKKSVVEPVVSVFDSDAAAANRVWELEQMLDTDAGVDSLRQQVDLARDAASDDPELVHRIDRVEIEVDRRGSAIDEVPTSRPEPTDTTTVDRPVPTTDPPVDTTTAGDRPPRGDRGDG